MNKKKYIAPQMEIADIELVTMIATSGTPEIGIVKPGTGEGSEGGTEILSNKRRGKWGNLWHED